MAVSLMDVGEVAEILSGLNSMYGEMGLPPDIPPKANFKLDVTQHSSVPFDYSTLDFSQKLEEAKKKKESGNYFFKRKGYKQAINLYTQALKIIDSKVSSYQLQQVLELRSVVHCNVSTSLFKLSVFEDARQSAQKSVKIQPSNAKAYIRLGQAEEKLGNPEEAIKAYKKSLSFDATNRWLYNECLRLSKVSQKTKENQQKMYSKMFWGSNPPPVNEKQEKKPGPSSMAEGGSCRDKPEPEFVPRPSGLHCRNSQVQCENGSLEICSLMNCLGYGPQITQARRDAYREHDRLWTAQKSGSVTRITTGSKAEGLTGFSESDFDYMFIVEGIMCLENVFHSDELSKETYVFTLDTGVCYHGHARLNLLERRGANYSSHVRDALCKDENGRDILSSAEFLRSYSDAIGPTDVVRHERAGPSLPLSLEAWHHDNVFSLRCHCPCILLRWAERSRHWPPPDIVHKVVTMGAFVVPVGFKGSDYQHLEWRIGFNTGENELMRSLNNTQVYIYILLKMAVKDILKPGKKEISSYTVKNIVLWLAENNPQAQFNESSLLYWLREGLDQLRTAILKIQLSYYMIPERNLMEACGLDEEQKRIWVNTITDMMNECLNTLLRLPRIRKAKLSHPKLLMWYNKKIVELELLFLKSCCRNCQCKDEHGVANDSDPMMQEIKSRMRKITREVHHRMNNKGSIVDDYDFWKILKMMLM
ncbi:uncharacterized protein LOC127869379 isoform X2 [Dreissena polymorpha]|uniref:uncharacterized protein LOC127869379 isoform X2 n=1 Tax=Dreissena polymorpha TaxID=45954 RepID=UPI0022643EC5|nr:uncharacterized protein LOC127869379 isoform X2 [Dreissena polymorpha]